MYVCNHYHFIVFFNITWHHFLTDSEKGGDSELIRLLASITMPLSNSKSQRVQAGSSASLPARMASPPFEDEASPNGLKVIWLWVMQG